MTAETPVEREPSPFDADSLDYDEVLNRGLAVSGEDAGYFARKRVEWLARGLRALAAPTPSILDYGCGHGTSAPLLAELPGARRVLGVEKSLRLLGVARARHSSERIRFAARAGYEPDGSFDLAFCNGVFHHIPRRERSEEIRFLLAALRPGGLLALWENNPWNPGTRYIMSRIAFDRGSETLSFAAARGLVRSAGFEVVSVDHLFLFPRRLRGLRPIEPFLSALPLGAQYQILCRKPLGP